MWYHYNKAAKIKWFDCCYFLYCCICVYINRANNLIFLGLKHVKLPGFFYKWRYIYFMLSDCYLVRYCSKNLIVFTKRNHDFTRLSLTSLYTQLLTRLQKHYVAVFGYEATIFTLENSCLVWLVISFYCRLQKSCLSRDVELNVLGRENV